MDQENTAPLNDFDHEKLPFVTLRKKVDNTSEEKSSNTPKRPLLSRDRGIVGLIEISPLSERNRDRDTRPEPIFRGTPTISLDVESKIETSPILALKADPVTVSTSDTCAFVISPPRAGRSAIIDDDDNTYVPAYIHRKAKPAPSTTWKTAYPLHKLSSSTKLNAESVQQTPTTPETTTAPTISFQPALRSRVPMSLSSASAVEKQAHAYTIWLNSLFTPVDFMPGQCNTTTNQSTCNDASTTKSLKATTETNRWYLLRDRAREVFTRDIQSIAAKISADMDVDNARINPKADLNFSPRTVSRQALLNFISSYNRIWFRLAMEVLFPINIENYQQMKLSIEQYLIQATGNSSNVSNETNSKKSAMNNSKVISAHIRLTIKNLILIVLFLERAKILRLIDNDPCLYVRESKFKSTKESFDVLSRDFISSDTNLIRRLKLAGFEPTYRQTSLDEYNYLITITDNKLFDDLKDGIRLTRCAQILLASANEAVARYDLSNRLKCPVVNLVHKLLNIDQAFELLDHFGHVTLTGISNKDIMNGNKQRTLELLWRIFITCYLPKYLSPIEKLDQEISALTDNLSTLTCRNVEKQLIATDILPLQKQQIEFPTMVRSLIKWCQLICAHYKFWLYDLQESFVDGRAFLYIISYYLPSLCDYNRDIKHLTTLAVCQTQDEHIQFNMELGQQQQQQQAQQSQTMNTYERNIKSNFRLLEECIKQFGSFPTDMIKYEYYAKDIPDERYTIIVLAMLAHDLLFNDNFNNEIHFRQQSIFQELKDKYSIDDDPIVENNLQSPTTIDEIKTFAKTIEDKPILESKMNSSIGNTFTSDEVISMINHETIGKKSLKPSISSTTITLTIDELTTKIHPLPIIPSEALTNVTQTSPVHEDVEDVDENTTKVTLLSSSPSASPTSPSSPATEQQDWSFVEPPACVYDQTLSDSLYASLETMFHYQTPTRAPVSLSQSVINTMNHDILDHVEPLRNLCEDSEEENDNEESFNSARSGVTMMIDSRPTSIAEQTTSLTFHDLAELEKTIENEENKTNATNASLFLADEPAPSETDSAELNKNEDNSFADPINTKMIKETLTLFLAHQQQTLEYEDSLGLNNESTGHSHHEQISELTMQTEEERVNHAAKIFQAHWRGQQVRAKNLQENHPVVTILERIRTYNQNNCASMTLRERMMQIVQEYSEASSSSVTAYLHFLRDVEPIVACCLEIRYMIAQQGLLRLFFILMRCCNRSGPSAVLLSKVLSILQLFTVKRNLIIALIDKQEQIKDFIMLLLKYYQKNSSELFEQICSLLESISSDDYARRLLRSNKAFTDAIEYVYKRVFNKSSAEDEKYRQQVRSTPKQSTGPQTRRATLLNQSSILYPTPKMMRPPAASVENIFKKNLVAMEKFMKVFYSD